jgi:ubiquinone/menaquinone biosynthesis C-methylase UbiE
VNTVHNLLCSSRWWARRVEDKLIPFGLAELALGDDVLEIGPGFGATTRLLADRLDGRLTALELETRYCARLRSELGDRVSVVEGDATRLPFEDWRFSAVICFTMLHHIADRSLQDRAFAECARVLRPGGVFAGTDSIGTGTFFKVIHIREQLLLIDPGQLPARLAAAGLEEPFVERADGTFRFRARKPPVRAAAA